MANTRQSVVKHILTEGDRIVVSKISPLGDQGGYAIAINYGSFLFFSLSLSFPQDQC